jgi:hypothetical protein
MSHKRYRKETDCLNCGTQVIGKFCHNCGQENIETRENFFAMVWHFITDYFHFDSKFFRSLAPLIVKPGFLTREYWEGRRTLYIPPLRIFFFVTIIFMIATSYFYKKYGDVMKNSMIKKSKTLAGYDSAQIASMAETATIYLKESKERVSGKQLKEMSEKDDRQYRKLQSGVDFTFRNLKYVTFFLLPVYALIFKLLFIRRNIFYIDHLIWAMHLQTFAYIFLTILLIVPIYFPGAVQNLIPVILLALFIYVLFGLRYLHHQHWWKTALKSGLATFFLFFVTTLTIVLVSAVDAVFFQ